MIEGDSSGAQSGSREISCGGNVSVPLLNGKSSDAQ